MISVDVPFGFTFSVDPKNQKNVIFRCGSCLSLLLLHVYPAYFFAAGVRPFLYGLDLKLGLAYMVVNFLSYFLWYSLKRQEKRIHRLVHMQRLLFPNRGTSNSVFFTCVLAYFTLFPFAYGGLKVYLVLFHDADYTFYSLGYPIENSFFKCLLMFFGSYGLCLIYMKWPCLALWSMCHTLNEGANILRVYNKRLKDSFSSRRSSSKREQDGEREIDDFKQSLCVSDTVREYWSCGDYPLKNFTFELFGNSSRGNVTEFTLNHRRERRVCIPEGLNMNENAHSKGSIEYSSSSTQLLLEILTEYFKIIKMIRLLKDTLSLPSFFITVLSFSGLYSVLAIILLGAISNEEILREVLLNGFTGISVIVSLGYCGAKIPQRMYEIRITCSDIIIANEIDGVLDFKELSLLKRLEKVDMVHISACEFVVLSRSFIVASFGSILTFGLLIFNLK